MGSAEQRYDRMGRPRSPEAATKAEECLVCSERTPAEDLEEGLCWSCQPPIFRRWIK